MSITAIETRYKGYRFRSRLEARWAVFFDALNLRWEYEKEGYELPDGGRYLPDFWLPDLALDDMEPGIYVEIKPAELEDDGDSRDKAHALGSSGKTIIVFYGLPHWSESGAVCTGDGEYYAWFLNWHGWKLTSDHGDITAEALWPAEEAARSARFEHGETPKGGTS